jgi:pimeloyl-ACP methyl ester carboxylesterase
VRISASYWEGDGSAALLFLHGLGEGAYVWDGLVQRVRDRNRALTMDFRGHGESSWAPDGAYSIDDHAGDLLSLVEQLDLRRILLVAHSMGASVALRALRSLAARMAALCIVDMGPASAGSGHSSVLAELEAAPRGFASRSACLDYLVATRPFSDPIILARYVERSLRHSSSGELVWKRDPRVAAGAGVPFDAGALREAEWPTLVVRGAVSSILSAAEADRLAASTPLGRVETVARSGHAIMSENPSGLAAVLARFVSDHRDH